MLSSENTNTSFTVHSNINEHALRLRHRVDRENNQYCETSFSLHVKKETGAKADFMQFYHKKCEIRPAQDLPNFFNV